MLNVKGAAVGMGIGSAVGAVMASVASSAHIQLTRYAPAAVVEVLLPGGADLTLLGGAIAGATTGTLLYLWLRDPQVNVWLRQKDPQADHWTSRAISVAAAVQIGPFVATSAGYPVESRLPYMLIGSLVCNLALCALCARVFSSLFARPV